MSVVFDPLQAAVRRALEFDPDTRGRLRELDGRAVEVVLTGLERRLCLVVEQEDVLFSGECPREPDLRLRGSPVAFARYMMAPERQDISRSGITIEGDIGLAQRFVSLLRQLDIDWEEWASTWVGDVAAHRAGRMAGALRDWARESRDQLRQDVREYLQEEARLLAPRERVRRVISDIDLTRSDVERLAERVKRVEKKLR